MRLLLAFFILLISPSSSFAWHDYASYGDWDYHGSGRDHPYSSYIDRANYIGYADYSLIESEPVEHITLAPLPAPAPTPTDVFTVNIPNSHGGYTPIVIRRSGNGFIGPQGEYYPEFPRVFQLKIIYGS